MTFTWALPLIISRLSSPDSPDALSCLFPAGTASWYGVADYPFLVLVYLPGSSY